jgi:hypothetical protein
MQVGKAPARPRPSGGQRVLDAHTSPIRQRVRPTPDQCVQAYLGLPAHSQRLRGRDPLLSTQRNSDPGQVRNCSKSVPAGASDSHVGSLGQANHGNDAKGHARMPGHRSSAEPFRELPCSGASALDRANACKATSSCYIQLRAPRKGTRLWTQDVPHAIHVRIETPRVSMLSTDSSTLTSTPVRGSCGTFTSRCKMNTFALVRHPRRGNVVRNGDVVVFSPDGGASLSKSSEFSTSSSTLPVCQF